MLALLWLDLIALGLGSVVAVLDVDVELGRLKVGRPAFGLLVLAGLLATYSHVIRSGVIPVPGYGILAFALLYLPFLSHSFIDLDLTDRVARRELEGLLLGLSFPELRAASGHGVVREGGRMLRVHWEARAEPDGILLELDVHPSTLPITVSRPHVATVRDEGHLERIRGDIRRRRGRGDDHAVFSPRGRDPGEI